MLVSLVYWSGKRGVFNSNLLVFANSSICSQHKKWNLFQEFLQQMLQCVYFLRIWSHLLKKSFKENFIFCSSYSIVAMSYGSIYPKLCFTESLIIILISIFSSILFFHLKYIKNDTPTIQLYLRSLELTKIYLGRASDNCSQWWQRNGSWS